MQGGTDAAAAASDEEEEEEVDEVDEVDEADKVDDVYHCYIFLKPLPQAPPQLQDAAVTDEHA